MSQVCVVDVRVQDTFSRRHAEHSTRPEVKGVRSTWQLNTYSCSQLLQTYCVIGKVINHILNRNGARWHYNTLML